MEYLEAEHWIFLFVLAIVLYVVWLMFGDKCPKCGGTHAMKRTGRRKGDFESGIEEWKCKHCGHLKWKDEPSEG